MAREEEPLGEGVPKEAPPGVPDVPAAHGAASPRELAARLRRWAEWPMLSIAERAEVEAFAKELEAMPVPAGVE